MSEVDALFRLLTAAPPRSADVVKRVALQGMGWPELATLYGVTVPQVQLLVFRAFLDVGSGGSARVPDEREPAEVEVMLSAAPGSGEGAQARKLWDRLTQSRDALKVKLDRAAAEHAASPDRDRDEWLRRIAIVMVLALTAYFWWREEHKPRPPPQKRPITAPVTPPQPG